MTDLTPEGENVSEERGWKVPVCEMTGEVVETDLDHDGNVVCDGCAGKLSWVEAVPLTALKEVQEERDELRNRFGGITGQGLEMLHARLDEAGIPRQGYAAQGGGICEYTLWGRIQEAVKRLDADANVKLLGGVEGQRDALYEAKEAAESLAQRYEEAASEFQSAAYSYIDAVLRGGINSPARRERFQRAGDRLRATLAEPEPDEGRRWTIWRESKHLWHTQDVVLGPDANGVEVIPAPKERKTG